MNNKIVVYQVLRDFLGILILPIKAWGTKDENGVGKFSDFTEKALLEIKKVRSYTYMVYRSITSRTHY